ncbi:unnamed protein product, partial [Choristocarpus tenellus]
MLFTVYLGKQCSSLVFHGVCLSPTCDPMLRGVWDCVVEDCDLARCLSPGVDGIGRGFGAVAEAHLRTCSYHPSRCVAELSERGELLWACKEIACKGFRLINTTQGVMLVLAGVTRLAAGTKELPWQQDVDGDHNLATAATEVQRVWRGSCGRKQAHWVELENEARRQLERLHEKNETKAMAEAEREMESLLEQEPQQIKVMPISLTAPDSLPTVERRPADAMTNCPSVERVECMTEDISTSWEYIREGKASTKKSGQGQGHGTVSGGGLVSSSSFGISRFEMIVTIDGTEVVLTAEIK